MPMEVCSQSDSHWTTSGTTTTTTRYTSWLPETTFKLFTRDKQPTPFYCSHETCKNNMNMKQFTYKS